MELLRHRRREEGTEHRGCGARVAGALGTERERSLGAGEERAGGTQRGRNGGAEGMRSPE